MTDGTDPLWEDLILAMLSVNRYSLDKTYLAADTMRREGLFCPQNLMRWTPREIGIRLRRGGYNRGEFMTNLFANRLTSLGLFIKSKGVEECERILRKGNATEISQLLQPVKGIGQHVLINFSLLRNAESKADKA
jgi:hypothetical protein